MAVFIDRPLQTYAPGTYSITRTIPENAVVMRLKAMLSDPGNWPLGRVADVRLIAPSGPSIGAGFDGGVTRDKQGEIRTFRSFEFSQNTGTVVSNPFPTGDYSLEFEVAQTAASALTVEWF